MINDKAPLGSGDDRQELHVDRQGLVAGLSLTLKCKALGPGEVSFEDGKLKVAFADFFFSTPATGHWYGIATVPPTFFKGLARGSLPGGGLLPVSYQQGTLTVGIDRTNCKWKAVAPPTLELPADAHLRDVLMAGMEHNPEHIQRSGLAERIARAENERDSLLLAAATILTPLGITPDDLRNWLDEHIRLQRMRPGG